MPSFFKRLSMEGLNLRLPSFVGCVNRVEQRFIRLGALMEHACINGCSQQVVGGRNGMDITGEVQVEFLHRDDLAVTTSGSTAFDAKGGTLGWLADAGDHALARGGHQVPG